MRKNLKQIPVFAEGLTTPIDYIGPCAADDLVALGFALSLKGRAVKLLRHPRTAPLEWRTNSASPGPELMERYVFGKFSGHDPAAIAAIDGVAADGDKPAMGAWAPTRS